MVSKGFVAIGLVLGALVSGCSAPPGTVAREWSKSLRELGITPVFPPREDVQVGDIYLDPIPPEDEAGVLEGSGYVPLGVWVGQVPGVADKLSAFYGERGSYPATPLGKDAPTTQPVATDDAFTDTDVKRLRVVGFPMFMSATLRQGSLSASVPAEAATVGLGLAGSSATSVTVSVPRAESCGLPAVEVLREVTDRQTNAAGEAWVGWAAEATPEELLALLPDRQAAALKLAREAHEKAVARNDPKVVGAFAPYAYVRVITEVYYARELDVQIEGSTSGGGNVDAAAPVPGGAAGPATPATSAGKDKSKAGDQATPADQAKPGEDAKPAEKTPAQLAQEMNAQLDAGARSTPGVGARFVAVAKNGVSLRTTFERPVAIGYRAISLKVFQDGRVEAGGNQSSAVPTAAPTGVATPAEAKPPTQPAAAPPAGPPTPPPGGGT